MNYDGDDTVIDATYMNHPVYARLSKLPVRLLNFYEQELSPKNVLDRIFYYIDGRWKRMKILKSVRSNKLKGIDDLDELKERTLEKIAEIRSLKKD